MTAAAPERLLTAASPPLSACCAACRVILPLFALEPYRPAQGCGGAVTRTPAGTGTRRGACRNQCEGAPRDRSAV